MKQFCNVIVSSFCYSSNDTIILCQELVLCQAIFFSVAHLVLWMHIFGLVQALESKFSSSLPLSLLHLHSSFFHFIFFCFLTQNTHKSTTVPNQTFKPTLNHHNQPPFLLSVEFGFLIITISIDLSLH